MKDSRTKFPIEKMCKVLKVSKSGYYKWLQSGPSKRALENQVLVKKIRRIYDRSKRTYGSPRITSELHAQAIKVSRPRVARLMKKEGIRSRLRKKYVVTTDSKHGFRIVENLLDRNFNVGETGKVWSSDITYIRTAQGWLYLTVIIDLGDRKVVGWSLSRSLQAQHTSMAAWRMATNNRPIVSTLIFHSDRGVQYACDEFVKLLAKHKTVQRSMSRKGNCWDNAVAESFFKSLKAEWTNWRTYKSIHEAEMSVFQYIEGWYNVSRRHSALGYMSPFEYEQFLLDQRKAA
jgi:transposase InsO family protein